jgi:hypothetical protein
MRTKISFRTSLAALQLNSGSGLKKLSIYQINITLLMPVGVNTTNMPF